MEVFLDTHNEANGGDILEFLAQSVGDLFRVSFQSIRKLKVAARDLKIHGGPSDKRMNERNECE
jgi:hypothetical protein